MKNVLLIGLDLSWSSEERKITNKCMKRKKKHKHPSQKNPTKNTQEGPQSVLITQPSIVENFCGFLSLVRKMGTSFEKKISAVLNLILLNFPLQTGLK